MISYGQAVKAVRNGGALAVLAISLAACESSSRLGSLLPDDTFRSAPRVSEQAPAPLTPAPAGDVESSSLPPPPGTAASSSLPVPGAAPGVGTAPGAQLNVGGQLPAPGLRPGTPPATSQVATAPVAVPSRTALVGNWAISEAAGNRCRITLSSASKLDLYGAATSGCQNKELQRVNAWELAGSEVILYEAGGGVVARLRQAGVQSYNGATAKSGAPVSLSK